MVRENSTFWEARRQAEKALVPVAGSAAGFEADCLMDFVLGMTKQERLIRREKFLSQKETQKLWDVVAQRLEWRPLQYILGQWEFFGLSFFVGEGVLVPRPDTETLVEAALSICRVGSADMLDLCSGSGCVAIAAAVNRPGWRVKAAEKHTAAFGFLSDNSKLHGNKITGIMADVLSREFISDLPLFDVITANPPYISREEYALLSPEVKREPAEALLADKDGLEFFEKITEQYKCKLLHGGALLFETGHKQAASVKDIMHREGYSQIQTFRDINGIERVVAGIHHDS